MVKCNLKGATWILSIRVFLWLVCVKQREMYTMEYRIIGRDGAIDATVLSKRAWYFYAYVLYHVRVVDWRHTMQIADNLGEHK